ncbi:MAG: hypothetical protein KAS59_02335 [Alphaproteobacteria bacterium]|nr:hypothetical protein [Alphaproteobacteria bacterium]
MKVTLLGSSNTVAGLTEVITAFYCGTKMIVKMGASHGYIRRTSDGKIIDGVTVRIVKGRYHFETTRI